MHMEECVTLRGPVREPPSLAGVSLHLPSEEEHGDRTGLDQLTVDHANG